MATSMNSESISSNHRFALLGASRGLGWATYEALKKENPEAYFFLSSRKILDRQNDVTRFTQVFPQDFSSLCSEKDFISSPFLSSLKKFKPTCVIYFAGGGPYGFFEEKSWASHLWSLNTTFLFPAQLLHQILSEPWAELKQIVFIGSSVAEAKADPMAASYAAAKHALKGLIDSFNLESKERSVQVKLFSPGYMQTDLIPKNSPAYHKAESVEAVAQRLLEFLN